MTKIVKTSLVEPDWANMPEKKCFAPCPPDVHCDCRERDRALRFRDGTFTTLDMIEADKKPTKNVKRY